MLKKIVLFTMMLCLSMPVLANKVIAADTAIDIVAEEITVTTDDVQNKVSNSNIEETTTEETIFNDTKQSTLLEDKEFVHVIRKFLITMLLVLTSCLIIFFILKLYKRSTTTDNNIQFDNSPSKNLTTPENVGDAIKLFIEKF